MHANGSFVAFMLRLFCSLVTNSKTRSNQTVSINIGRLTQRLNRLTIRRGVLQLSSPGTALFSVPNKQLAPKPRTWLPLFDIPPLVCCPTCLSAQFVKVEESASGVSAYYRSRVQLKTRTSNCLSAPHKRPLSVIDFGIYYGSWSAAFEISSKSD